MLFKLSDGKTLIAFHHNRSSIQTADLGGNREQHLDRSELWFATSTDGGHTWSEPRFLLVNALAPAEVSIIPFEHALAIKITVPRTIGTRGSGSPGDRDVYGAQQHGPLLDIPIA